MAQINATLYAQLADYYADIYDNLQGVSTFANSAVDRIVDVQTTTYTPAGAGAADRDAALDVELDLMDVFNASATAVGGIASSTGALLDAVRAVNNYVIGEYSNYPAGSATTPDTKLKEFVNSALVRAAWLSINGTADCPLGWAELSQDAGYDTTGWATTS